MPILDLQRRMRQLGEIRIGHVVDTGRLNKAGKPIKRPAKLDKFRFTSPSKQILEQVAALYGGTVQPWTPANGGPTEWEVYSTTDRLPILIPPRNAVSQWYELYAGSKCLRRCDGVTEQKSDKPCICDSANRQCAITTRINVMLRDVPALGQWLLITKGYYAATTLPDAAELLALVGGYVPGWLGMEEKVVQGETGPNRFMIPTIDVDITPAELMAGQITSAGKASVDSGTARPAIESAPSAVPPAPVAGPPRDFLALAHAAKTKGDVVAIGMEAKAAGAPAEYLAQLKEISLTKPDSLEPAEEVIDLEPIEGDDPVELYMQVMAAAGARGWSTQRMEEEFAQRYGGTAPGSAEAHELREFRDLLKGAAA